MADTVNDKLNVVADVAPSKAPEKDKKTKKKFFLVRWWNGFVRWFKELKSEAKKVTWPSFRQVCKSTAVVALVTVVIGGLVILADLVFREGLDLFVNLF